MQKLISIEIEDHEVIRNSLLDEKSRLKDSIYLEQEVKLSPLFTSLKSKKAVGGNDILNFILSFPGGVAIGIVSNLLYDWLKKNKVSRTRIEKTEIIITKEKKKTIHIIIETLIKEK